MTVDQTTRIPRWAVEQLLEEGSVVVEDDSIDSSTPMRPKTIEYELIENEDQ